MQLFHFHNLSACEGLTHFQTGREGGHSMGTFATTNMSYSVGDDAAAVLGNRRALAAQVGVELEQFVFIKQVHSDNIAIVTEKECGRGVFPDGNDKIEATDGLITNTPGVVIGVKTADCIPVLLYNHKEHVIAALHAGWRGTAARIVPKAVALMASHFGCLPADTLAAIGAGAGLCCYQVSEEVYGNITASLHRSTYPTFDTNRGHIDLKEINRLQLIESGVSAACIEVNPLCSICHPEAIFSHRASGGHTGRSLTAICMKK